MNTRTTPLGFLLGNIEVHSHCMYNYTKKDETFIRNVVDFLSAGLSIGEAAVCVLDGPAHAEVVRRIAERRDSGVLRCEDDQLIICHPSDVYLRDGLLDPPALLNHWRTVVQPIARRMNGARVYSDTVPMLFSRLSRLKLLENESLINIESPMTVSLCGYQSDVAGRSYLAQARNAHPYLANSRSIRRNPAYLATPRFLSGLYRFRRVSKEYPASPCAVDAVRRDLVEVAGRTPLTMREIEAVKAAITGILSRMLEHGAQQSTCGCDRAHLRITFTAESDKILVTIRDHTPGLTSPLEAEEHSWSNQFVADGLLDELMVESWKGDLVITAVKRYRTPYYIDASDMSVQGSL